MERARAVTLADAERIAGVPAAQMRQLAEWYHTLSPAAISVGNGLERNQNGGNGMPRDLRAARAGRQARGARRRPRQRGEPGLPEDHGAAAAARPGARGHAHAQHRRRGRAPARSRSVPADQGAVHLQPQPRHRASRPEPHAPGPPARGSLHRRGRRGDDRQHGLLRRRAARGDALRVPRPLCRLRRRTGSSGRSR